jgi:hypothetical protein
MNPFQFNVVAIILILGIMPFAVAFVSNAGSSTDEQMQDSITPGFNTNTGESKWLTNGGENWSWYYDNKNFYGPNSYEVDCTYVQDGFCYGLFDGVNEYPLDSNYYSNNFILPMNSIRVFQTHFIGSNGNNYVGSSGDESYGWRFGSEFFGELKQNTTVDKLKFTFVEPYANYNCDNSIFSNLTFEGEIIFHYQGETLKFENFEFEESTKYKYNQYDNSNGHFTVVCVIGFDIVFDFTGFESLKIDSFNYGNWSGTVVDVILTNFDDGDDIPGIGQTVTPFGGDNYFQVGVEHSEINPKEAGFIIKTGTLVLSAITFIIAIASTPYWDPFKNFFNGRF